MHCDRNVGATAIEKVGLSQERAGVFFGMSPRQGQRWALGERDVPDYVARFLCFMVKHGFTAEDME